eukprot:2394022-Heterocapsa_arctica.AAC.1
MVGTITIGNDNELSGETLFRHIVHGYPDIFDSLTPGGAAGYAAQNEEGGQNAWGKFTAPYDPAPEPESRQRGGSASGSVDRSRTPAGRTGNGSCKGD